MWSKFPVMRPCAITADQGMNLTTPQLNIGMIEHLTAPYCFESPRACNKTALSFIAGALPK